MNVIKTRKEAEKVNYGSCSFNRISYKPDRCVESIREEGKWPTYHQCTRKPGFGPDNLYCKQHDPAEIERKAKERDEKWRARSKRENAEWSLRYAAPKLLSICKRYVAACEEQGINLGSITGDAKEAINEAEAIKGAEQKA